MINICPHHPQIGLPHMFTCPLCAQEARRKAYIAQLAEVAAKMAKPAQQPPRPATDRWKLRTDMPGDPAAGSNLKGRSFP